MGRNRGMSSRPAAVVHDLDRVDPVQQVLLEPDGAQSVAVDYGAGNPGVN
jgi:hypothetical protein